MKNPFKNKKTRMTILSAALLLLAGIAVIWMLIPSQLEPEAPPSPRPPEVYTPHVLPAPSFTEDNTDYEALAFAVFENVSAAPESDFSFEITSDDTVRLTAYVGNGGTVIIPEAIDGKTVTSLGEGLFRDSETVTALSIPESVTEIGPDLLTGCRTIMVLRTPQLGANRTDNGFLAYFFGADTPRGMGFKVPSSLDTLILWDTVTKIDDYALMECSRIRMVLLPKTLTSIGNFAFFDCSQLHFVPLPDSLQSIGEYAFADCKALISVEIKEGVQSVGLGAFMGCQSLEQITLPFIGDKRNSQTNHHLGYIFGAETYTWNAGYIPKSLLKVTLTNGDIPDYAFYECDGLALVELPDNCKGIGIRSFYGCDVLRTIVMPDSMTNIGDLAFAHCVVLNDIQWSAGLQSVGIQAFMDCFSLTTITLPDSLTILPNSMFADCRCLEEITLGKNVQTIGNMAFYNCTSIKKVSGGRADMTIGTGNETLTPTTSP